MPGDRRVVRAAFFTRSGNRAVDRELDAVVRDGEASRGRGVSIAGRVAHRGRDSLSGHQRTRRRSRDARPVLRRSATPRFSVSDLVLEAKPNGTKRLRAETRLTADTYAVALRPEIADGLTSIEVSARRADGGTEILLFVKDPPADWPTPYIFSKPVFLSRGTTLAVTAYYEAAPPPGGMRLRVNRY